MSGKIRIGITQGDPNGIGWEVILKCFADPRMGELITPVLYGSSAAAAFWRDRMEEAENIVFNTIPSARNLHPKRLNLIETGTQEFTVEPGQLTPQAGESAVEALRRAVKDAKEGLIDAIVTAPICKENTHSDNFPYTGHTEFLGTEWGGNPIMMMCSEELRVALMTTHIPLAEVRANLSKEKIVEKLKALRRSLIADFGIVEPRIAVLSLNPHAGENGLLGEDEEQIIRPAIEQAFTEGVYAFGPLAADGLFLSHNYTQYDAVLAMYHDQGLAPFKALTPDGVNYTAGLPIVRTSPDHGVAFDIAGAGKADPGAMRNAIWLAADIVRTRQKWAEMSRNPLRHYAREKGADVSANDLPENEPTE